jgi:hypothetical protein
MVSGLIVCALAGLALVGMTAILTLSAIWPGLWLANLLVPASIMLVGLLLLAWGVIARAPSPDAALQPSQGVHDVVESNL